MTKKEQFLNIWVKRLPESDQQTFIKQLEALLEPVRIQEKPRYSFFQNILRSRLRHRYNKMARRLAKVKAMLEVYTVRHTDIGLWKKVVVLKGERAQLETYLQQIRNQLGK